MCPASTSSWALAASARREGLRHVGADLACIDEDGEVSLKLLERELCTEVDQFLAAE
jgi:hypothetical protein